MSPRVFELTFNLLLRLVGSSPTNTGRSVSEEGAHN